MACAPQIKSISRVALVKWRKARRAYEVEVRARNGVMISVISTMDPGLLEMCCQVEWEINRDDLTEAMLVERLDDIIEDYKNGSLPNIACLFAAKLKMDLKESDVKARVIKYFCLCAQIIEDEGLIRIFRTEHGQKQKCKLLRRHLRPAELKKSVELALLFAGKEVKRDPALLYKVILERALEQERFHQLRKQSRHRVSTRRRPVHHRSKTPKVKQLADRDSCWSANKKPRKVPSDRTSEVTRRRVTVYRTRVVTLHQRGILVRLHHDNRMPKPRIGGSRYTNRVGRIKLA